MIILAIETSCDETSVAVVQGVNQDQPIRVLSCVTASSLALHSQTGGIIPERAARKQLEYIIPTLSAALSNAFPESGMDTTSLFSKIDAIAVTTGPGLIGSLLVGVETAKTLSAIFTKPLIPVNHVKAHIYGTWIEPSEKDSKTKFKMPSFPLLAAVISGGHTDFVLMENHGSYEWVGGTRDDAAGECFDKCARLLGLPYPGGPSISKLANEFREENPDFKLNLFPRPMIYSDNFDVSFSGLKTSVLNLIKKNKEKNVYSIKQLSAEVEEAIAETLISKIMRILEKTRCQNLVVCGGVSGNTRIKNMLVEAVQLNKQKTPLHVPELKYSTDNAAMIGAYAFYNYDPLSWIKVSPDPELHF